MLKPANDNGPLGRVFTLEEAAEYMRISKQALAKAARANNLCSIFGRDMLFSESDLLALWDAMRCRSSNSNVGKSGTSEGPCRLGSEQSQFTKALDLLTKKKRKSTAPGAKGG